MCVYIYMHTPIHGVIYLSQLCYQRLMGTSKRGLNPEQWWLGSCIHARKKLRARQMKKSESACKKEIKSKIDAKKWKRFIENESTQMRGKCRQTQRIREREETRKSWSGISIPLRVGIGDIPFIWFIHLLPLSQFFFFSLFGSSGTVIVTAM